MHNYRDIEELKSCKNILTQLFVDYHKIDSIIENPDFVSTRSVYVYNVLSNPNYQLSTAIGKAEHTDKIRKLDGESKLREYIGISLSIKDYKFVFVMSKNICVGWCSPESNPLISEKAFPLVLEYLVSGCDSSFNEDLLSMCSRDLQYVEPTLEFFDAVENEEYVQCITELTGRERRDVEKIMYKPNLIQKDRFGLYDMVVSGDYVRPDCYGISVMETKPTNIVGFRVDTKSITYLIICDKDYSYCWQYCTEEYRGDRNTLEDIEMVLLMLAGMKETAYTYFHKYHHITGKGIDSVFLAAAISKACELADAQESEPYNLLSRYGTEGFIVRDFRDVDDEAMWNSEAYSNDVFRFMSFNNGTNTVSVVAELRLVTNIKVLITTAQVYDLVVVPLSGKYSFISAGCFGVACVYYLNACERKDEEKKEHIIKVLKDWQVLSTNDKESISLDDFISALKDTDAVSFSGNKRQTQVLCDKYINTLSNLENQIKTELSYIEKKFSTDYVKLQKNIESASNALRHIKIETEGDVFNEEDTYPSEEEIKELVHDIHSRVKAIEDEAVDSMNVPVLREVLSHVDAAWKLLTE